ncbi:DedA family protein [Nitratifractor sp.]|uniref:DedA family protein n=1 Tax=Nitratifractor sp. TaxID=2268144 RepID=UPI0025F25191|nr:DedA family protein [Nitratifractor sp.]
MLHALTTLLIQFADSMGYFGVYCYMLLVGTFIPVPSEILLIPAGYLASLGEKSFALLLVSGALGSLSGALINYALARYLVHRFFKEKPIIKKVSLFFRLHGKISVFLAPLTPGLGQYISIPAGLSHMRLRDFIPLTFTANLIWVGFMLLIGYIFGEGQAAHKSAAWFSLILLGFVIVSVSVYVWREMRKAKLETA